MKKVFLLTILAICCGCGRGNGPIRVAVAGDVAVDGTPIAEGSILFIPAPGTKGPVAGASITGGRYSIAAAKGPCVGPYRVEIHGSQKTGRRVKVAGPQGPASSIVDEIIEIVPAKYNTQSTLVADLKAGKNRLDFAIATK